MPNTASAVSDKIGHIMNYGDGWYGGVYIAAMYSLAFVNDDIEFVVTEALKTIPEQSDFYQCMTDVMGWCKENENWQATWQLLEDKWGNDLTCPSVMSTLIIRVKELYLAKKCHEKVFSKTYSRRSCLA